MNKEEEILLALANNLSTSFKYLVMQYQDMLFSFALRLSGHPQEAEDIVQEAFLGSYLALKQYDRKRIINLKTKPWLYRIVLNVFNNRKRKIHQIISLDTLIDDDFSDGDKCLSVEEIFDDYERMQELEQLLELIPDQFKLAVTLFYFEDFSQVEIANLLDLPLGTVKSRLYRGVNLLKNELLSKQLERRQQYESR